MPTHLDLPYRRAWSVSLLVWQLVAAGFHFFPRLVYPARPATTAGVVALSQQIGPIWVIGFAGSAALLLFGLIRNRGMQWAHAGCATVWVIYAAVLFTGAIVTKGTYWLPTVVTFLAVLHAVCAWFYNDYEERAARRERRGP
jgi:hypothetical protein